MTSLTRGRFLGAAAGAAGVGLLTGCDGTPGIVLRSGGEPVGAPDLIAHGRLVHTMDDEPGGRRSPRTQGRQRRRASLTP
ncbi:MAG: hypothetical protein OXU69_16025 [Gemmatimonadota bacterium]|nr:hypothetical protein [Gemmatimonadota bacterium]MDE2986210.1 hypothetical protein [Gemmatimonadota bacterium]